MRINGVNNAINGGNNAINGGNNATNGEQGVRASATRANPVYLVTVSFAPQFGPVTLRLRGVETVLSCANITGANGGQYPWLYA